MHSSRQKKPKKDKIKREKVEVVPPQVPPPPDSEKDLTHFIKDRVELMKQVFSILKDRELLAMAPQCLRTLQVDDLQELCLEEVLGISSKRLRSVLDGFECPSDTDSSQEAISLDSISSDEGTPLKVKKKGHHKGKRHQRSQGGGALPTSAPATATAKATTGGAGADKGTAGMTVLELLELQARARAIRAQLQAVHANIGSEAEDDTAGGLKMEGSSEDEEVVIKEEPAEVVELVSSSDESLKDEKKVVEKTKKKASSSASSTKPSPVIERPVPTKSLVVSMPVTTTQNPPRKIKLNRNNLVVSVANVQTQPTKTVTSEAIKPVSNEVIKPATSVVNDKKDSDVTIVASPVNKDVEGNAKRPKNKGIGKATKKKKTAKSKSNLDEDEIMLELSDTEKMDLLDSFNSSSSDASGESDSTASDDDDKVKESEVVQESTVINDVEVAKKVVVNSDSSKIDVVNVSEDNVNSETEICIVEDNEVKNDSQVIDADKDKVNDVVPESCEVEDKMEVQNGEDLEQSQQDDVEDEKIAEEDMSEGECSYSSDGIEITEPRHDVVCISDDNSPDDVTKGGKPKKKKYRKRRKSSHSSNQEVSEKPPEKDTNSVVLEAVEEVISSVDAIPEEEKSTEDIVKATNDSELDSVKATKDSELDSVKATKDLELFSLDIFEISDEWSDDDVICLSKEPTTEEIEELSKKVDSEIQREEIVFETSITGDVDEETRQEILKSVGASGEELTDNSWKERWLQSDKVKRVLATSNLCNAMRKKNKEIKMKLGEVKTNELQKINDDVENANGEETKNGDVNEQQKKDGDVVNEQQKKDESVDDKNETGDDLAADTVKSDDGKNELESEVNAEAKQTDLGSVDFYMTLPSCTKYVDPKWAEMEKQKKEAMTKDARQLMRMYKRLLKIHNQQPEKKKKKKKKDKKEKKKSSAVAPDQSSEVK